MVDWDPKPNERTYYRSTLDGQRGYLVKRNGVDSIRLDRPMEEIVSKLDDRWRLDSQQYPLNPHQLAKVAFSADRALCQVMGKHVKAKEWLDLTEKMRIAFMEDGPGDDGPRDLLYCAIMETMKELTGT